MPRKFFNWLFHGTYLKICNLSMGGLELESGIDFGRIKFDKIRSRPITKAHTSLISEVQLTSIK